ncbi:TPA: Panacea domain-containing protein [Vibrio mimicus]
MVSADIFAKALLQRASENGIQVSNLKLQKLAYYCQGYHLAQYEEPLFDEDLKAWDHGPVVRSLYEEYQTYKKGTITASVGNAISELSGRAVQTIDFVLMTLGNMGAWQLREKSHREAPWLAHVSKESKKVDYQTITHQELIDFFAQELNEQHDRLLSIHMDRMEAAMESEVIEVPQTIQNADDFYNWIQSV